MEELDAEFMPQRFGAYKTNRRELRSSYSGQRPKSLLEFVAARERKIDVFETGHENDAFEFAGNELGHSGFSEEDFRKWPY